MGVLFLGFPQVCVYSARVYFDLGLQLIWFGLAWLFSEAAMFDVEYARWLDEHNRVISELQAALQEQISENELRMYVESFLAHCNEMVSLKSMVAKTDVFHLLSGIWKSPAERCFMWMGGFRPSDLIKVRV